MKSEHRRNGNKVKSMRISSIILVDIGNTSTQTAVERAGSFVLTKRIPTQRQTTRAVQKIINHYTRRHKISGAILCSVVPRLDKIWMNELKRVVNGKVLRLNHELNLGIKIKYPYPATIGPDRLANAVGAYEKYGAPVVVADFGTALTFDIVSSAGAYVGGIIAPGPALFTDYLAERTALLPRLSLAAVKKKIKAMVGKSTREAMLIGLQAGYPGMAKEIIRRLKQEPGLQNARFCATGGYAEMILAGARLKITIDPWLTLRGISRIYWLNN